MKYSSFDVFQLFKNIKTILSTWAIQKQAVGQIWPTDHGLPIPALCDYDLEWKRVGYYSNKRHYDKEGPGRGREGTPALVVSLCTLD